jgi:hypothetical protein
VYQLIAENEIPAVRIGNRIVIPRAAFDEWLAAKGREALSHCGGSGGSGNV